MHSIRSIARLLLVAGLLFAISACGSSSGRLAAALPTPTPGASAEQSAEPTATPDRAAPEAAAPTERPAPTEPAATATPTLEALQLGEQGFGQTRQQVGYSFFVTNPNAGSAIEDAQYQLAVYDESGAVLKTDSGSITLVLPGQRLGVGGTTFLEDGQKAAKIEVQIQQGEAVASEQLPAFTVDTITDFADDITSQVTAKLTNPYAKEISNLRVSAVAYNKDGAIIGGGFSYVEFVPANDTTGIEFSYVASEKPSSIEIYPTLSNLSLLSDSNDQPADVKPLVLTKHGFGQDDQQLGYGMIVENPNTGFSVERTPYRITVYDDQERIATVEEGYISVLLPGQTLGIGDTTYLPKETQAQKMVVQIGSRGEYVESAALPAFSSDNITFKAGSYTAKVTGMVISPYAKDITNLRVSAIAYDDTGAIIGGGFTFVDFVPANGKAAADVSVVVTGAPATVELYGTLSALSDFK